MTVNGEKFDLSSLASGSSVINLVDYFKLSPQRVAIELNGDLIARTLYAETRLSEGDIVEIIHYVGGG